jgi:hypothetical protein
LKKTRTSGTLVALGVKLREGVAEDEGVGESDALGVVVGVGVGVGVGEGLAEALAALESDAVVLAEGVGDSDALLVGLGVALGLGVGEAQTAAEVPPVAEASSPPPGHTVHAARPAPAHEPAAQVAQLRDAAEPLDDQAPLAALRSKAKLAAPALPAAHASAKRDAFAVPGRGSQTAPATAGSGGCERATASVALSARAKTRTSAIAPARPSASSDLPPTDRAAGAPSAVSSETPAELAASAPST